MQFCTKSHSKFSLFLAAIRSCARGVYLVILDDFSCILQQGNT